MILCAMHRSMKDLYGAGNWKDVAALDSLWADLAITPQTVEFDSPPYSEVLERCDRNVTDVIVHYSRYPDLLQSIHEAAPRVRVHVRAHNQGRCRWMGIEIQGDGLQEPGREKKGNRTKAAAGRLHRGFCQFPPMFPVGRQL